MYGRIVYSLEYKICQRQFKYQKFRRQITFSEKPGPHNGLLII